jgi:DNA-binding transcriptional ArsR family regulator
MRNGLVLLALVALLAAAAVAEAKRGGRTDGDRHQDGGPERPAREAKEGEPRSPGNAEHKDANREKANHEKPEREAREPREPPQGERKETKAKEQERPEPKSEQHPRKEAKPEARERAADSGAHARKEGRHDPRDRETPPPAPAPVEATRPLRVARIPEPIEHAVSMRRASSVPAPMQAQARVEPVVPIPAVAAASFRVDPRALIPASAPDSPSQAALPSPSPPEPPMAPASPVKPIAIPVGGAEGPRRRGVGLLAMLLGPLGWKRVHAGNAAKQATRAAILARVRARPGVHLRGLAADLALTHQNVAYHLRHLESCRLLASARVGRERRFFQVEGGPSFRAEAVRAAWLVGARGEVLAAVQEAPGSAPGEVARRAGVASGSASWALRKLVDAGLVEEREEGAGRCYYPSVTPSPASGAGAPPPPSTPSP